MENEKSNQVHERIKAIAKIAVVLLILGGTIKALCHFIVALFPVAFWGFILLGVYGLYLLITEKKEN